MNPESNQPRVVLHGRSVGGITKADIERRARELALIRQGNEEYNDEDLAAARRELMGAESDDGGDDSAPGTALTRDPSDPPAQAGRQAAGGGSEDENTEPERLARQGVDEAEHDQMVEARRKRRDQPE